MKRNFKYICGLFLVASAISCKKDLDINTNPNSVTSATVDLVLPQAIVATANSISAYNTMGAQQVGYFSNSGGVSGWGGIISYNWTTGDFQGLWATSYDVLEDVQYVLNNSSNTGATKEFNAAAKVLKAYNYSLLVDTYNDVPYSEALLGADKLQPKYDKAQDIYKNIADLLDQAIATFKTSTTVPKNFTTADPLFGSSSSTEIARWMQFAQTLKLKLVLKGTGKGVTFTNSTFDSAIGFLTDDAIVNPGYTKIDGKQNVMWSTWAYAASGTAPGAASQYAVTGYILPFYNGIKINDPARAAVVFRTGLSVPTNQLGYQQADAGRGLAPSSWFIGTNATTYDKIGILKGPDAGQPLMLAAESYFLQAEANVRGIVTGTVKTNFDLGIRASFRYLYKDNTGAIPAARTADADAAAYQAIPANATRYLVNIDQATTDAQRTEAIITQKYIAFNMLFGHEAWNEYRRTGYPTIVASATPAKATSFVSLVSESTAPDKLPTRILYPANEYKYNAANVPTVNKYSDKIFWAK
jgi:hypothetical protein